MKVLLLLCLISPALFPSPPLGAPCPAPQAKDGNALIQLEQTWAQSLELHDADAVGCILAEEFQDTDPNGKLHGQRLWLRFLTVVPARTSSANSTRTCSGTSVTSADWPP